MSREMVDLGPKMARRLTARLMVVSSQAGRFGGDWKRKSCHRRH